MRAFIAVDFSSRLKGEISLLQSSLRSQAVLGRWKYIDNFHLTLKFLGEVKPSQLQEINLQLDRVCSNMSSFYLEVSDLGSFPGRESLRVLFLKLGGDINSLNHLQAELEERMNDIGFLKEKRSYTPHVTIGQDIVFEKRLDEIKRDISLKSFDRILVDRVYLFKSEQIGNKRIYTQVSENVMKL